MDKSEKRRKAISGIRPKRTTARKEDAGTHSTGRPPSKKPQCKVPQTRKTKMKTSQIRQRSKTRKQNVENLAPTDPMTSPNLGVEDLDELRKLEQLFLDNQSVLRNLMPAQPETVKLTPPPSRRSGISIPQSRSGIIPASRSGVVAASRSGQIQPSRSGANLSSKSGTRSKTGVTNNKQPKSKEDANAHLMSNSVSVSQWSRNITLLPHELRQKMELRDTRHLIYVGILLSISRSIRGGEIWPLERPEGMPAIQSLEVMCGKDHMDVHLSFTQPFEGIVSSKGQYADPRCVYVPPATGKTFFSFRIAYARCGTKPDLNGQFYENTVVVQYDKDLLEVWDEAKRLRCEWYNDYEKTASKPPMVIADLDVIQLDFRGDNVDCWMEIQHGKGPWAPPVSGIVPLGSTLTLVVAINDNRGEFDMRVKSCAASDGGGHVIHLSDEFGCVLRPKMISRFLKARIADERASVITYAFFHAFKFPDALSVHIKCKVEICRHGCLDHCQFTGTGTGGEHGGDDLLGHYGPLERKDSPGGGHQVGTDTTSSVRQQRPPEPSPSGKVQDEAPPRPPPSDPTPENDELIYDEMVDLGKDMFESERVVGTSIGGGGNTPHAAAQHLNPHQPAASSSEPSQTDTDDPSNTPFQEAPLRSSGVRDNSQERFPHGPRNLDSDSIPLVSTLNARKRRSVVVSDRKVRSADVGVSGLYEVISEADLAFTPDSKGEAVTVFQGRIREEVVYGICLPVPGFSALFVLVAVSAVVSALVAGALLYRYQVQRETQELAARHLRMRRQQPMTPPHPQPPTSIASWVALRLLRPRAPPSPAR